MMAISGRKLAADVLARLRKLLAEQRSKSEVGRLLGLSRTTVKKHAKENR